MGMDNTEVMCPFLYISHIRGNLMSVYLITGNVDLGSLVKMVSVRFLHYKVTIYDFVNYEMFWGRYFGMQVPYFFLKTLFISAFIGRSLQSGFVF